MFGNCRPRRRRNFPRKSAKGGWGGEVFPGFMLRWFGQVFPPWSDHPLAPFEEVRTGFWKLWKGAKFLQRTHRTSCRGKFLHGIFGFGRLSGELLCEPKTTTPRKTGLQKLKICKFSLVFGKICFFLESLSSVAVFGWILTMQTEGFGTSLASQ